MKATTVKTLLPAPKGAESILAEPALRFLEDLAQRFAPRVRELLVRRHERQARFDRGERPDFLPETAEIRRADWKVAPPRPDLSDRRVEITGPTDRKMVINALNSGASVFMADFEDSNAPTWENLLLGQKNLWDAVRREIAYEAPETGRRYELAEKIATLMVRPRGWHLPEKHLEVAGEPIPGSLFDFGLFFFHNARELVRRQSGPYFYLPKMESHLEARLWNDVFAHAERLLELPAGTVRATCLIETLPAAFEMDEILWELRERSAGLNCGRWDYIFSFIKKLAQDPKAVLPDRATVTMDQGFLAAYVQLLIRSCHRRGAHAMGGMAAQIPIKHDSAANEAALAKVRADKLREARAGHDGTWVAHPGLVAVAREVFDREMPGPNQLDRPPPEAAIGQADLLRVPEGPRSEAGLRHNVRVGIQYLEAWLRGQGCVPLYQLMEDAATAEISRAQVWQWIQHRAPLDGLRVLGARDLPPIVDEELEKIRGEVGEERFARGRFSDARALFERLATAERFEEFLTLPAYETLLELERADPATRRSA